jgi:hypothetical protein
MNKTLDREVLMGKLAAEIQQVYSIFRRRRYRFVRQNDLCKCRSIQTPRYKFATAEQCR